MSIRYHFVHVSMHIWYEGYGANSEGKAAQVVLPCDHNVYCGWGVGVDMDKHGYYCNRVIRVHIDI